MKKFLHILIITALLFSSLTGCTSKTEEETGSANTLKEDLSSYFSGYNGCFLLFDQNENKNIVYNENKALNQISPCSTFKIINTLVGLETKVLKDENSLFKWDGTQYPNDIWNQDHTLSMAVSNSTFWYFQQVASLIGSDRMKSYLDKIDFGNKDVSGGITQFWEESSLKISPSEWLEMLKKIYMNKLPISKENIDILKKVIKLSEANGAVLSGKTGSGLISGQFIPQSSEDKYIIGWFVGYVEKSGNVYYFVTNIEGADATGITAKEITLKILKDKGIF